MFSSANVLIAATIAEDEHHARVSSWLATAGAVALCPIVEGALARFLVRIGERIAGAQEILRLFYANPRCEFWTDALSYADGDLSNVGEHHQVTDAYLAALVEAHEGSQLATLDEGLAQDRPGVTFLVPPVRLPDPGTGC